MSVAPLSALVRRAAHGPDTVPDAELLARFVRSGDQAAFELLVWRHGAMVWGACRRILDPDRDAAEDACQAAFVALAAHARRIRDRGALAAWLHRVAVRAASDLRAAARRTRPLPSNEAPALAVSPDPLHAVVIGEVRSLLDAGVNHLPDKLRLPFVMCELEGRSNAETAAALGCPVGTIESRLTRARLRLRDWLTARGVVPALAVAVVAVPETARAAMVRAGNLAALKANVRELALRAVPSASSAPLRVAVTVGVVLVACAVGLGVTGHDESKPAGSPAKSADAKPPAVEAKADTDDTQLPAGAVARFGSPRLRHGNWVYDVCFSPDGKRIASVGQDAALRMWDAATGKQLFIVRREKGDFGRVCFAPGGRSLVTVGHSADLLPDVWWIDETGKVTDRKVLPDSMKIHKGDPAVRFSRDGARLAIGTAFSNQLVVLDALTAEALWTAKLDNDTPGGVCFAPDGKTVAVATIGGKVHLFDADGKPAEVLKAEAKGLTNVTLSPDGSMVVANARNNVVAWARATGKVLWKQQVGAAYSLTFSPDGKAIVCSAYGRRACTLDPADGLSGGISGKSGAYFDAAAEATCSAFRPDGSVVAFGTSGGAICLFDPKTGKLVAPSADPPHEVQGMRFSPDGKTLYGWAGDWFAWNVVSGKQTRVTDSGWNYGEPLSPDGKFTARSVWYSGERPPDSPDDGERFEIRNAKTGAVVHSYPGKAFQGPTWMHFTPDGEAIVGGALDGSVRAWAIDTGKELFKLPGQKVAPRLQALSSDGRVLVTGTYGDATEPFPIRVYDLKAAKELARFHPGPGLHVTGVAVSGDGRRVAAATSASARGMPDRREVAIVWEVPSAKPGGAASGKVLARAPQMSGAGFVALSPDGRLLAVAPDWAGDVRVHEVASGAERFAFRHDGQPTDVLFAPDGRTLVVASKEAPILLWDVTGERTGKVPAWESTTANRVWDDLASRDAAKVVNAIRLLRTNPAKAVPLLAERTKLPALPENLKQLLEDLGSADFATREKATDALAALGEAVRPALVAEEARTDVAEAKKRLGELLGRLDAPTPARLRLVRAAEVVEGIGTREAKELLERWAGGAAGATLAAEAKAALLRAK
jgi:RNA polymerase sigma factor (sigma-70 family)